ncbi:MAG: imidazole glycerol phosphate synthase subunit HisH [Acidimicrobiales bacterium]|nr:imidazole glycerol phosphate synthase subunit HisH [Acidimicrobiales bacterium]
MSGERPLIAVLDYGIGNLRSAQKSLERHGADARLTADPAIVGDAAGVVLPGVGAFGACMDAVERTGVDALAHEAVAAGTPFLGICVGMQLLYEASEETPGRAGLGILPGTIQRLAAGVKHPQMQWNVVEVLRPSPLFDGLDEPVWMYFVHSFAAPMSDDVVATCDYGGPVVAAVEHGNVHAVQFHPEKSSSAGLAMVDNFVGMVRAARGVS